MRLHVRAEAPHEAALDAVLALAGTTATEEEVFRTGEAARLVGVGVETLRCYERRGLLAVPRRRPSGQREYTLSEVRLVRALEAHSGSASPSPRRPT